MSARHNVVKTRLHEAWGAGCWAWGAGGWAWGAGRWAWGAGRWAWGRASRLGTQRARFTDDDLSGSISPAVRCSRPMQWPHAVAPCRRPVELRERTTAEEAEFVVERCAAMTRCISPPSGGTRRSSIEEPELRVPTHAPLSHSRSPMTAFAGVGIGMSSAWR